jgi:integrase/recombinase XerD
MCAHYATIVLSGVLNARQARSDDVPGCVEGPLGPWAEGFAVWLADRGYTSATAADQMRRMGWLSDWLADQGLTGDAVSGSMVVQFAALMRATGHPGVTPGRMAAMLTYLRAAGTVPPAITSSADPTTRQQQLASYRTYLADGRGLAPDTVQERLRVAGVFLNELGDGFAGSLTPLRVLEIVTSWGPLTRSRISPLRSFLRYLYAAGHTGRDLAMVIPAVRRRETARRPVRLDAAEAAAVLHGITRSGETVNGRAIASPVWDAPDCLVPFGNLHEQTAQQMWQAFPYKQQHLDKYLERTMMVVQ